MLQISKNLHVLCAAISTQDCSSKLSSIDYSVIICTADAHHLHLVTSYDMLEIVLGLLFDPGL